MSGSSSAAMFARTADGFEREPAEVDGSDDGRYVAEPGRGIALGVFLSVPLWLLLAWTIHTYI